MGRPNVNLILIGCDDVDGDGNEPKTKTKRVLVGPFLSDSGKDSLNEH